MTRSIPALVIPMMAVACATAPVTAQVPAPVNPPPVAAEAPPPAPATTPTPAAVAPAPAPSPTPIVEDPGLTAGGALQEFMISRNYRSIRALRAIMTAGLRARFDKDSSPFNGKRTIRIAAFDSSERDLKPSRTTGGYQATVRTLWEDQGEAVERRTESVGVARQPDGLWRVSSLDRNASEFLRYNKTVDGLTSLRMLLRAWHRGDLGAARSFFSAGFEKRYQGRDDTLRAMFAKEAPAAGAPEGAPHAAFEIVEMTPRGEATMMAKIRLYEGYRDRPAPIEASDHVLRLIRLGAKWLLDAWD